ncbi:hypothetical protein SAMN05216603_1391, partial [Pseudomonas benzenivorans]
NTNKYMHYKKVTDDTYSDEDCCICESVCTKLGWLGIGFLCLLRFL